MIKLRYKKIDGGNSIHKTKLEKGYKMKDRGKSIHETNNKKIKTKDINIKIMRSKGTYNSQMKTEGMKTKYK